jgi:hypothetical protein
MKRAHQRRSEIVREKGRRRKEFQAEWEAAREKHWAIWKPKWEEIERFKKTCDPVEADGQIERCVEAIEELKKKCEVMWWPIARESRRSIQIFERTQCGDELGGSRKGRCLLVRGRVSKPRSLWAHPDLHKGDSGEEKEFMQR